MAAPCRIGFQSKAEAQCSARGTLRRGSAARRASRRSSAPRAGAPDRVTGCAADCADDRCASFPPAPRRLRRRYLRDRSRAGRHRHGAGARRSGLPGAAARKRGASPRPEAQALSEAENLRPDNHHAPHITVARRLGGASNLWGGRCLPYDAVDFQPRPWLGLEAWPIDAAELAPWLGPACAALDAGRPVYHEALRGVTADDAFGYESLERWSNTPRTQVLHRAALETRPDLLVALGATALGFDFDDGRADRRDRPAPGRAGEGGPRRSARGAGGGRQREHPAAARRAAPRPGALRGGGRPARPVLHGPCQRPDRRHHLPRPAPCTTG